MEWRAGMLRDIAVDGHLVYRALGPCVRDGHWNTIPGCVEAFHFERHSAGARLEAKLSYEGFGLRLRALFRATFGFGSMSVDLSMVAEDAGWFNRIGLILLHPMPELIGQPYRIAHVDGSSTDGSFQETVADPPAFTSVRAIAHQAAGGWWCECVFGGEDFETEDQRVFSDASLKTYGRSNSLPRPFKMEAGDSIEQSAEIVLTGGHAAEVNREADIEVELGEVTERAMPPVGIAWDHRQPGFPLETLISRVGESGVSFLLYRFRGIERLEFDRPRLVALNLPVVVEMDVLDEDAGAEILDRCSSAAAGLQVRELRLTKPSSRLIEVARSRFTGARIGVASPHGILGHYRSPPPDNADFVAFGTSAIVHDADPAAIMATTRSFPAMIHSLASRTRLPIALGPSAIGLFNHPHAQAPLENRGALNLPMAAYSPLIEQPLAAAWLMALLAETVVDVESACVFSTHGPNGLVDDTGELRPLCEAFSVAAICAGGTLFHCNVSDPACAVALAVRLDDEVEVIVINRTAKRLRVQVKCRKAPNAASEHPSGACQDLSLQSRVAESFMIDAYGIMTRRIG
jgi:hypothetical protein